MSTGFRREGDQRFATTAEQASGGGRKRWHEMPASY